jgi:hypothetical protein
LGPGTPATRAAYAAMTAANATTPATATGITASRWGGLARSQRLASNPIAISAIATPPIRMT